MSNHYTNMSTAAAQAKKKFMEFNGKIPSPITIGRVNKVDTKRKLVNLYLLEKRLHLEDVPYAFPYTDGGFGILYAPRVGSLAIVTWDITGKAVIIGFTIPVIAEEGGLTRDIAYAEEYNSEELLEGEVAFLSIGGARIKLDTQGGVSLSTPSMDSIRLRPNGKIEVDATREISLKVGGQRITMDKNKIKLAGIVEIEGELITSREVE